MYKTFEEQVNKKILILTQKHELLSLQKDYLQVTILFDKYSINGFNILTKIHENVIHHFKKYFALIKNITPLTPYNNNHKYLYLRSLHHERTTSQVDLKAGQYYLMNYSMIGVPMINHIYLFDISKFYVEYLSIIAYLHKGQPVSTPTSLLKICLYDITLRNTHIVYNGNDIIPLLYNFSHAFEIGTAATSFENICKNTENCSVDSKPFYIWVLAYFNANKDEFSSIITLAIIDKLFDDYLQSLKNYVPILLFMTYNKEYNRSYVYFRMNINKKFMEVMVDLYYDVEICYEIDKYSLIFMIGHIISYQFYTNIEKIEWFNAELAHILMSV